MEAKEVKISIPEGYEIDKENSTFECIKFKRKDETNTWEDLKSVQGYYINTWSNISKIESNLVDDQNKNIFASEKHAKSALALAQISQLIPYYGGEITDEEWSDSSTTKYVVDCVQGHLLCDSFIGRKGFIAFHTKEQRNAFMSFPENIQLVKDFYMMS